MTTKSHYYFGLYLLSVELYRTESMEPLFLRSLLQCRMPLENDSSDEPYMLFLEAHQDYLSLEMGKQRDISFALRTVPNIVHVVSSQTLYVPDEATKKEVLYENPAHI